MSVDIDTSRAPGLVRYTYDEHWPGLEEQERYRARLVSEGLLTSQTRLIVDLRRLKRLPFLADLRSTLNSVLASKALPRAVAIVAVEPAHYGVGRMAQAVAAEHTACEVFTDEHLALAWLESLA